MSTILLVEDDPDARPTLERALKAEGYDVIAAADGASAIAALKTREADVLLCDLVLPGAIDGMRVFEEARRLAPEAMTIFMTAHGTVEMAVKAMKEGAYDFLEKPLNLAHLRALLSKAVEKKDLVVENQRLRSELADRHRFGDMIGTGPAMREVFRLTRQVASSSATILILGESGAGKELIASAIHYNSPRAAKPFVKVNCNALPESLLESELFGHVRGAFTGAVADRKGRFEAANGGTLFLDEIGELPASIQVKLLRVLQEGEFESVGSSLPVRADVRILAATNADLEKGVAQGRIREDFYYRIKGVTIRVPSLRDRREDIPFLAEHFAAEFCRENKRAPMAIDPATVEILKKQPWPGNVRQLSNAIETAIVLSSAGANALTPDLLPQEIRGAQPVQGEDLVVFKVGASLEEVEKGLFERTLAACQGNKTQAARILGVGVRTLYRKMEKYRIEQGEGAQ